MVLPFRKTAHGQGLGRKAVSQQCNKKTAGMHKKTEMLPATERRHCLLQKMPDEVHRASLLFSIKPASPLQQLST